MATADNIKLKIQGLIDKSNETTGKNDPDLTKAVGSLVEGYGQGGETRFQQKDVAITQNGTREVIPDSGYALSKVKLTVNVPVPDGYLKPYGSAELTTNGSYDIAQYERVMVDVPIPDGYIKPYGSAELTTNGSYDIAQYERVMVDVPIPDGYLKPTGSRELTANGSYDISQYERVMVDVPNSGTPTQEKDIAITQNGSREVTPDKGYALSKVKLTVNVPIPDGYLKPYGSIELTKNGSYDIAQYERVMVDVTENTVVNIRIEEV